MAFFRVLTTSQVFSPRGIISRSHRTPTEGLRHVVSQLIEEANYIFGYRRLGNDADIRLYAATLRQLGASHPFIRPLIRNVADFGLSEVNRLFNRRLNLTSISPAGVTNFSNATINNRFIELADMARLFTPAQESLAYNAWRFEWLATAGDAEASCKRVTPVRTGRLRRSVEGSFGLVPPYIGEGKIIRTSIMPPGTRGPHIFSVSSDVEYARFAVRDRWDNPYRAAITGGFFDAWSSYFTVLSGALR